jgi:hypothetical protein
VDIFINTFGSLLAVMGLNPPGFLRARSDHLDQRTTTRPSAAHVVGDGVQHSRLEQPRKGILRLDRADVVEQGIDGYLAHQWSVPVAVLASGQSQQLVLDFVLPAGEQFAGDGSCWITAEMANPGGPALIDVGGQDSTKLAITLAP